MARWDEASRSHCAEVRGRLAVHLAGHIPRSCTHLRGCGGVKGAIRVLRTDLDAAPYVARFDIASYYTSMRHDVLLAQLRRTGAADDDVAVVRDYLSLPDTGATGRGMVASGGLSPLLGGLYLAPLDRAMDRLKARGQLVQYVRYMDDVVLLAKSRWQLRRAIAALHAALRPLHLRLHRVKRFIGRTSRGFDFLGYRLHPGRKLRPSGESLRRLRTRARRLYEREGDGVRLRQYVRRWWLWLHGGLWGRVRRAGGAERITRHVLAHLLLLRPRGP
ncbi:MAG: RNA-directed DNA polymerase [Myxococcota bacterium]|jgi:RNA-directed DNA polymerase